jgi:hypothetical protein
MKQTAFNTIYESLPDQLVSHYKELTFENHCYLRIALDNTFQNKWDSKIKAPAYKYLNEKQLSDVLSLLKRYLVHKEVLIQHHKNSVKWRNTIGSQDHQLSLF